jgi:hypothetical protein
MVPGSPSRARSRWPRRILAASLSTGVGLFVAWLAWPRLAGRPAGIEIGETRSEAFALYVCGGSTARGVPYEKHCGIGRIAAYLLGGELGGKPIEVVNVAEPGSALDRALEAVREIAKSTSPDKSRAVFLYAGDNEFLRYDTAHLVGEDDRRLLDEPLLTDEKREEILADYASTLDAIAVLCRESRLPLFISTVGTNLAGWEPNRSVLRDPQNARKVRDGIHAGELALTAGDDASATASFQGVVDVEPQFAWAWWRLGELARRRKDIAAARAAFQAAVDFTGFPMQPLSRQNALLRATSERHGLPLVDGERAIAAAVPDGLPGYDIFWDHVHPTLEGQLCVARALAQRLLESFEPGQAPRALRQPTADELRAHFRIDDVALSDVYALEAQFMYSSSVLIWAPARRLGRCRVYLDAAEALAPGRPNQLCTRAVLHLFEDDVEGSRALWERAYLLDPEMVTGRLNHPHVRSLLRVRGVEDPASMYAAAAGQATPH